MLKRSKELDPTKQSPAASSFEEKLRNRIVGQEHVIRPLADAYQIWLAGLNEPGRPISTFLMLGPTGTGKTHIVEVVADIIYQNDRAFTKIDCGEYQYGHEIAKFIGSPPGYLGFKETVPVLSQGNIDRFNTEKTKLSLICFDEIEKAHDSLWNMLLSVTDKAELTMGDGSRTSFKNSMIFFTANVGAKEMANLADPQLGFGGKAVIDQSKINAVAMSAAARKFSPEFMNRIDHSLVFNTLTKDHLAQILEIELGQLQQRLLKSPRPFLFKCSDEVKKILLTEGFDSKYNARHLKRAIQTRVMMPFAKMLSSYQIKEGDYILVSAATDGLVYTKEGSNLLIATAKGE